jgi:hypothetical protein
MTKKRLLWKSTAFLKRGNEKCCHYAMAKNPLNAQCGTNCLTAGSIIATGVPNFLSKDLLLC